MEILELNVLLKIFADSGEILETIPVDVLPKIEENTYLRPGILYYLRPSAPVTQAVKSVIHHYFYRQKEEEHSSGCIEQTEYASHSPARMALFLAAALAENEELRKLLRGYRNDIRVHAYCRFNGEGTRPASICPLCLDTDRALERESFHFPEATNE
jgi:hypothetical protein